jgi:sulfate-transporting ATPase
LAVDRLSLEVRRGQVLGLIGPNGAGKTSLMDAVTGFAPYSGTVRLDGVAIDGYKAHRRARAGMVRSFQQLELFLDMTVRENLQTASDTPSLASLVTDLFHARQRPLPPAAVAAVREFSLSESLDRLPEELPYGQQRLVAIARAVAMQPSVLLLDEPVAGLDDHESAEFAHLVRRLADGWGMAVLVIEHDMSFVMSISDHVVVLDFGQEIASGSLEHVANDPAALAAYLGEAVKQGV